MSKKLSVKPHQRESVSGISDLVVLIQALTTKVETIVTKMDGMQGEIDECRKTVKTLSRKFHKDTFELTQEPSLKSEQEQNPFGFSPHISLQFDGGASPNPGMGGSGCVIYSSQYIIELAKYHQYTTNNEAEYIGLLLGLRYITKHFRDVSELIIEGDSMLVVNHCLGSWKCNADNLKPLLAEAKVLLAKFNSVKISHIPRDKNAKADELSNVVRENKRDICTIKNK